MQVIDHGLAIRFEDNKEMKRECEALFDKGINEFSMLDMTDVRCLADACITTLTPEHRIEIAHDNVSICKLEAALFVTHKYEDTAELVKQIKETFRDDFISKFISEMMIAFSRLYSYYNFKMSQARKEEAEVDRETIKFNHIFDKEVLGKNPFILIQGAIYK